MYHRHLEEKSRLSITHEVEKDRALDMGVIYTKQLFSQHAAKRFDEMKGDRKITEKKQS